MKGYLVAILFVLGLASCQLNREPVDFVDPMIGTDGTGHTYPGASLPFGMVQLSPDTRLSGWEGCSGYHYSDHFIYGFSHTHLSGTGALDYGDILICPVVDSPAIQAGSPDDPAKGYGSTFSHSREYAEAGYYRVMLDEGPVKCEMTTTQRTGFHRYTFRRKQRGYIVLDLTHRDQVLSSSIQVNGTTEIVGLRRSQSWAQDQYVYFVMQFNRPFRDFQVYLHDEPIIGSEANGNHIKAWFGFSRQSPNEVLVKVGISAVSIEGARKNLEQENPGWDFNQVRRNAHETWNQVLDKISVEGATDSQQRTFYTALYHQYLCPNVYMDVDGKYRGRDLLIHQNTDFTYYTLFSLWDTFRATHPLFALMEPGTTLDFIKTFLTQYEQGGMLPVWELSANETGTMIGYHSVPVIVDAYVKGIQEFDSDLAFEAMKNSADQDHLGLKHYKSLGYIPASEEGSSVSKTLEYAYDDWCIAQFAKALQADSDYVRYIQRSQYYKNLFDPSTGFMRAKMGARWFSPFDPSEVNYNYTEANAWQYSFFVPHDVSGLMDLLGGQDSLADRLDRMFSSSSETSGTQQADITGMIGQYAHGNEPSHHMAYLYSFVGQPWNTQLRVRQIMDELYNDRPDGLCGNEDCGQMSAWYLFSAMGFYPVTPGTSTYVLGSPLFKRIVLDLPNGQTFTVQADNNSSSNRYVQHATLNGQPYTKSYLDHQNILQGGILKLVMGPEPNREWGSGPEDLPVTEVKDHLILPVPFDATEKQTFTDRLAVHLGSVDTSATIRYQIAFTRSLGMNSSRPYTRPLNLTHSRKVWFFAEKGDQKTPVLSNTYYRISPSRKMLQISPYANQYSGGGEAALIDGLRGARNYRTGSWQGFEGTDLEAEIDLGFTQTVNRLKLSVLQDQQVWIFAPKRVKFWISTDQQEWTLVKEIKNDLDPRASGTFIKLFEAEVYRSARYIRVYAESMGTCPPWHHGAGGKAWIFADELIIE